MSDEKKTFDAQLANKAQEKYCADNGCPHFAPRSQCYRCNRNIYEEIKHKATEMETALGQGSSYSSGISVEKAGSELITGCPHCHYSYCD